LRADLDDKLSPGFGASSREGPTAKGVAGPVETWRRGVQFRALLEIIICTGITGDTSTSSPRTQKSRKWLTGDRLKKHAERVTGR